MVRFNSLIPIIVILNGLNLTRAQFLSTNCNLQCGTYATCKTLNVNDDGTPLDNNQLYFCDCDSDQYFKINATHCEPVPVYPERDPCDEDELEFPLTENKLEFRGDV